MTLFLTIRIEDGDHPERARQHVVEADDLWSAIHELRNVAGPRFAKELMSLSWHALTNPNPPPPDGAGFAVMGRRR